MVISFIPCSDLRILTPRWTPLRPLRRVLDGACHRSLFSTFQLAMLTFTQIQVFSSSGLRRQVRLYLLRAVHTVLTWLSLNVSAPSDREADDVETKSDLDFIDDGEQPEEYATDEYDVMQEDRRSVADHSDFSAWDVVSDDAMDVDHDQGRKKTAVGAHGRTGKAVRRLRCSCLGFPVDASLQSKKVTIEEVEDIDVEAARNRSKTRQPVRASNL